MGESVCFCCLWFWCAYEARKGESPQMKCLRRIMAPRADGKLLVPRSIVDAFRDLDNGGRESVLKMWETSGHDKDIDQFLISMFGMLEGTTSCKISLRHFKIAWSDYDCMV